MHVHTGETCSVYARDSRVVTSLTTHRNHNIAPYILTGAFSPEQAPDTREKVALYAFKLGFASFLTACLPACTLLLPPHTPFNSTRSPTCLSCFFFSIITFLFFFSYGYGFNITVTISSHISQQISDTEILFFF
ncbi:hypothetical protein BZA77DRAFT_63437 [Pyronema omphalodes]|nr:hypothetical protein BZA77DRAFT_63437 [Pyronema omphalodes]